MATPSEESKNGTSEPEVKKPSFSFGKTEEKKDEVSKPSFSFGSTSYGFYSRIHGQSEIVRSRPNHNPSKVQRRKTMKSQSHCSHLVKLNRNQKKRRIRQSFHLVAALTKPKKRQNSVLVLNPMIKKMKKKSPLNLLVDFLPI